MNPQHQVLGSFVDRLREVGQEQHTEHSPAWAHKVLMHPLPGIGYGKQCVYCGVPLALKRQPGTVRCTSDHVVPLAAGAPNFVSAMVPACDACNVRKGSRDWLLFGAAINPDLIRGIRLSMLASSQNHLVRDPVDAWKKPDVLRILAQRWGKPRTTFYASCLSDVALIGVRPQAEWGSETAAVLRKFAPVPIRFPHGQTVWIVERARFLDLVWSLIALNAWMRKLDIPGHPDATPQGNPEMARWAETYRNVGEIVLRRAYLPRRVWSPKRAYPRRPDGEPAPRPYPVKPLAPNEVRTQRAPRYTSKRWQRRQQVIADNVAWMKANPPRQVREPGPAEREWLANLTPYRRHLLDLGFRMLAYEAAGLVMPFVASQRKQRSAASYFRGRRQRAASLANRHAEDRRWEREHGKPDGWLNR